jgi:(p)ppGpp synthase/HD superfamily hydrolase
MDDSPYHCSTYSLTNPKTQKEVIFMFYSPMIRSAMVIAILAHGTQFDIGGYPYIHHPLHLAEQMTNEYSCAAALLHDVIEDSDATLDDLRNNHIPEPVIEAVALLTREPGTPYLSYIEKLSHNDIAREVKLADLRHNCDIMRLKQYDDRAARRMGKYRKAIEIIERARNIDVLKRQKESGDAE